MSSGPKTGEQSSSSDWGGLQLTPKQMGAKSPVEALGGKNYSDLVNGMYNYFKAYVSKSAEIFQPENTANELKGMSSQGMQAYEDRAGQIADMLMTSFATAVQPDEMKSFPLDQFVQSSVKEIYSKAKGIFDNPIMDRNEIKSIVDANTSTLAGSFRERRRGLEQEIQARGLSGPAATAARDSMERDIARGRDDVVRSVLGTQTANKFNTQLGALGQMQGATNTAEQVSTDYANRWLNQWNSKISANNLMLQGQLGALSANEQGANIEGQQYNMKWNEMNYPLDILNTSAMPFLSEIGRQDISANSGYGQSWGSSSSSGTQYGSNPWTSFGVGAGSAAIGGAATGAAIFI
ncbi:MAG: hypothetical protein WC455_22395 [Dehalococcoidia bacterium]